LADRRLTSGTVSSLFWTSDFGDFRITHLHIHRLWRAVLCVVRAPGIAMISPYLSAMKKMSGALSGIVALVCIAPVPIVRQ